MCAEGHAQHQRCGRGAQTRAGHCRRRSLSTQHTPWCLKPLWLSLILIGFYSYYLLYQSTLLNIQHWHNIISLSAFSDCRGESLLMSLWAPFICYWKSAKYHKAFKYPSTAFRRVFKCLAQSLSLLFKQHHCKNYSHHIISWSLYS